MGATTAPEPTTLIALAGDLPAMLDSLAAALAEEVRSVTGQWQRLGRLGAAREDCAEQLLKNLRRPLGNLADTTAKWQQQLANALGEPLPTTADSAAELLDLVLRAYKLAEDLEPNELEAGALIGDMQDALERHGINPDSFASGPDDSADDGGSLVIPADPDAQPLRIEPASEDDSEDDSEDVQYWRNYYKCPCCGETWQDEWDAQCNDRCPGCRAEIEPYTSEPI